MWQDFYLVKGALEADIHSLASQTFRMSFLTYFQKLNFKESNLKRASSALGFFKHLYTLVKRLFQTSKKKVLSIDALVGSFVLQI